MARPIERLKSIGQSISNSAERYVVEAYDLGVSDGRFQERQNLREALQAYAADSVVAKLLLEKFQET